jgi:hypothetical protein
VPIIPLLQGRAFGPEEIKVMSTAFQGALNALARSTAPGRPFQRKLVGFIVDGGATPVGAQDAREVFVLVVGLARLHECAHHQK